MTPMPHPTYKQQVHLKCTSLLRIACQADGPCLMGLHDLVDLSAASNCVLQLRFGPNNMACTLGQKVSFACHATDLQHCHKQVVPSRIVWLANMR